MSKDNTVLIIGANRGLGLEWTKQWLERGANVIATARQPDKADALQNLKDEAGDRLRICQVDVSSDDSVDSLADELESEPVDILIHNAGVMGRAGLESLDTKNVLEVMNVNSVGAIRTVRAFRDNLRKSGGRSKIALITSLMGSIDDNRSGGSYAYRMSKAALNMAGRSMSVDLASDNIDVVILHPGWVKTDMGGASARITVDESVNGMMKVLDRLDASTSGTFWHSNGKQLPW
ncbi:MAG: SDR family oxidoreductase [Candidatus Marinimicrobia bacterium]|nr:SDR family oxidoreductase [Candidatus Neomarinimicrobiota bacterium]MCF7829951.1 SDR family oxidoreductase [Candidatus Neomarinimicrobiota bacterium]MCF7881895.1 SDR family oxidoreductase [Candidatus Neomarinimicrobiota bacterium]